MNSSTITAQFWAQAFAGATPPSALGLALLEGLVPPQDFQDHGERWLHEWLSGMATRMASDPYDVTNRPWRPFGGAGNQAGVQKKSHLPARLKAVQPGTVEAGLLSVFQGFHRMGWDLHRPMEAENKDGVWATSLLEAAVAMNLPSVIDWAAALPDKRPAKELDESRAPINTMGVRTPLPWLHAAALGWQDTLVEALIDYGLDVNQVNKQGQTALFFARTVRTVKALVAAGVDVGHKDKNGRTAAEHWYSVKDFPSGYDAKNLSAALGSAAQTEDVAGTKLVLYVSKGPIMSYGCSPEEIAEDVASWWEKMPQWDKPIHSARMNPGGIWKGQWSPAAWHGLQALQGNMFYSAHTPSLLARPDFFSPEDYPVKGKLTERGLFGLGVLSVDFKWGTKDALAAALGVDWMANPQWLEPMQKASKALLDVKATNKEIRFSIGAAWLRYFQEAGLKDSVLGLKLWEAKSKASVSFERVQDWSKWFDTLEPGLRASFFLLAANDVVSQIAREETYHSPESGARYNGSFERAWQSALQGFRQGGRLITQDEEMEAAVATAIDRLSSFSFLGDEVAFLKERRLDKALEPGVTPTRAKPRI